MNIEELIIELTKHDTKKIIKQGFNEPHSYIGSYDELGLQPCGNISIGEMLTIVKGVLNTELEGYKGGSYMMKLHTTVQLANWGDLSAFSFEIDDLKKMLNNHVQYLEYVSVPALSVKQTKTCEFEEHFCYFQDFYKSFTCITCMKVWVED